MERQFRQDSGENTRGAASETLAARNTR